MMMQAMLSDEWERVIIDVLREYKREVNEKDSVQLNGAFCFVSLFQEIMNV